MESSSPIALNAATLAVIAALIGSLAGAISALFRKNESIYKQLVAAKDELVVALKLERDLLREDRDYYRDTLLRDRALPRRPRDDDDGPPEVRRVR